jgi:hypothetical protein
MEKEDTMNIIATILASFSTPIAIVPECEPWTGDG